MNIKISYSIANMLEEYLSDVKGEIGIEWNKRDFLAYALKGYDRNNKYPYMNNEGDDVEVELPPVDYIDYRGIDKVNLKNYIEYFIVNADSYLDEFIIAKSYGE